MAYQGLVFRTTDPDKWGDGKGSVLTATEVDENFYTIMERVVDLEENPPSANNIATIQVIGSQLMIYLTDGAQFGPFTLPVAQFRMRDDYLGGVQYYEMDLISVPGQGLFLVRLDHISAPTFDPEATDGDGNALYLKMFGEDTYIYTFGFFFPGKPGTGMSSGDVMLATLLNEPVYLPADAVGSMAKLQVPPDAAVNYELYLNGDKVGDMSFGIGESDAVIALTGPVQMVSGDVFYVQYPDDGIDATAKNLIVTFKGYRGELGS